ncbi:uncharacterized protein LOC120336419 [Styela clava]|uniref:uncharacterized protein LOC120336419 n=1 Tax=Styela clava TaxID=7725 RepID=UPI00193AA0A6|nr:uncharacterized protein LOC120336419 [Styela clava]
MLVRHYSECWNIPRKTHLDSVLIRMKILIVGFCKTGTKSVEKALEFLGYKVADYWSVNVKHYEVWKNYTTGKGCLDDLRYMYAGVDVASDLPAYMYWEDFLKAFPGIKLIFMTRDEDGWLKSWHKHWNERNSGILSMPLALFSPTARKCIKMFHLEGYTFFNAPPQSFRKSYEGIPDEVLKKVYREHNKNILKNAPRDRLLVLGLKEGWKPLCSFLDKPIPDIEFPHCNKNGGLIKDQEANHPLFKQMYFEMYVTWTILAVVIILLLYFLFGNC